MRYRRGDELLLKVEDDFGYDDITYSSVKVQVIGFNVDCSGDEAEYLCFPPGRDPALHRLRPPRVAGSGSGSGSGVGIGRRARPGSGARPRPIRTCHCSAREPRSLPTGR